MPALACIEAGNKDKIPVAALYADMPAEAMACPSKLTNFAAWYATTRDAIACPTSPVVMPIALSASITSSETLSSAVSAIVPTLRLAAKDLPSTLSKGAPLWYSSMNASLRFLRLPMVERTELPNSPVGSISVRIVLMRPPVPSLVTVSRQ